MKSIVAFFAVVFVLGALWTVVPKLKRRAALEGARRFLPAILLATAVTLGLLGLAIFTNGKVI